MRLFGRDLDLVILDVDGVILDVREVLWQNFTTVAVRLKLPLAPLHALLEAQAKGEVRGKSSLAEGIRELWPSISKDEEVCFIQQFRLEEKQYPYRLVHGSIQMIKWLVARKVPVALCTTNDTCSLLARFRATNVNPALFRMKSTAESKPSKPSPQALTTICETIGVPKERSVYVGDWWPDLRMAREAGVPFVAALSGGIPKHAFLREGVSETHIVERFVDLYSAIRRAP